ncbi:MAG: hypothetical protein V4633_04685 [Pseudomonadota bacterium]
MMEQRVLVGMIACGAKLLSLSAGTVAIEHQALAVDVVSTTRQLHGRGLWDVVPEPNRTPYAMGAASEVPMQSLS